MVTYKICYTLIYCNILHINRGSLNSEQEDMFERDLIGIGDIKKQ